MKPVDKLWNCVSQTELEFVARSLPAARACVGTRYVVNLGNGRLVRGFIGSVHFSHFVFTETEMGIVWSVVMQVPNHGTNQFEPRTVLTEHLPLARVSA